MKLLQIGILGFTLLLITSCGGDLSPEEQFEEDVMLIENFLSENGITAQTSSSGLRYVIDEAGNGNVPELPDVVSIFYEGRYLDGEVFDDITEGVDEPLDFIRTGSFVPGFTEGLQLIGEGGEITLYIPSILGYADMPPGNIRKNSVLVFDVKLVEIVE